MPKASVEKEYYAAVIGGGASGLMLAANLNPGGAPAVVIEGTSRLGSKLLMSGGGHCNITHGGAARDFVYAYGDKGQALRRCLYRHNNLELAGWLDSHGVALADEDGEAVDPAEGVRALDGKGRIFPASMKAKDVLDAFEKEARHNGWEIRTSSKVRGLKRDGESWMITLESGQIIMAANVVLASGGITYPETGSDGSMLDIAKELGIKVTSPRSALAPVYVKDYPYAELSGVSVKDVTVVAFSGDAACTCNGKSAKMKGDLLFTHEGLSGPVILNISRYVESGEKIRLIYNKEMSELPKSMQKALRERARGPLGDVKTNILASLLNQDDFIVERIGERGMVTAGGIDLDEIDSGTMQIIKLPGLYAIGEAIDADGITGGYNLQLCWSTACAAANALSESL